MIFIVVVIEIFNHTHTPAHEYYYIIHYISFVVFMPVDTVIAQVTYMISVMYIISLLLDRIC
jgi:hypothetical protein